MPTRQLSEPEFDAIKAKVLAAAPDGLKPDEFQRFARPALAQAIGEAENSPEPLTGSAISRFVQGAWKTLNPMGLVQAAEHPIDTASALLRAQGAEFTKFNQAATEGRDSEALAHMVAGLIPVVGPAAARAGERMGSGDVAGGVGEGAGLITSVEAPRIIKATGRGLNKAATAVAESQNARNAIGAVGGAAAGDAVGHPYLGMLVGTKYGGPIVKSVAEAVQGLTGGAPRPTVAAVLSDLDLARQEVAAGRLPQSVVTAMERAAANKAAAASAPAPVTPAAAGAPPVTPAAVAAPPPASTPATLPTGARSLPAAVEKLKLSADEAKFALEAQAAGHTSMDIQKAILMTRFQQSPSMVKGALTPEQVAAELANRVGNRSPTRP